MIDEGAAVVEELRAGLADRRLPAARAGEGQGVGGAAQIHLVHMLEASEAAAAVALDHQEHAAGRIEGHITDLVLAAAAAQQIQVLLHRCACGRIEGQDAGELRGAAADAGAVAVLVERALHEGVEQPIGGIEGHALDAPVGPAVAAVNGGQAVDRFGADRGGPPHVVLGLEQGLLAGGDVALDQVAGAEIEQGDLAAVLIAHGEHLAAAAPDGHGEHRHRLRVDAERVVGESVVGRIDRNVVLAGQLRQAGERGAIGAVQADAGQFADRPGGPVHAQFVDAGLEVGIEELALASHKSAVGATVGDREVDVELGAVDRFLAGEGEAGEATGLHTSRQVGGAGGVLQLVADVLGAGDAAAPVLDAGREDLGDHRRGTAEIQHGKGVVLLQGDPGGLAVGAEGDRFGFDVLANRGGHTQALTDADAAVDQLFAAVLPGGEADGLHIGLGRGHRRGGQKANGVDQGNRSLGINGVERIGLAFIGDQQLAAVGAELDHVGQSADVHAAHVNGQGRIAQVIELHEAGVGFDRVLHGDGQQGPEHRCTLEGFAAVDRLGHGHGLGVGRIPQIAHHHGAGATPHGVGIPGAGVVRGDLGVGAERFHSQIEHAIDGAHRGGDWREGESH